METFDHKEKVDILIAALQERYKAIHVIRGRVQSVGIWALGIMLTAGAWLIQSSIQLTLLQKTIYILGVVVAIVALQSHYLDDLKKGFKSQQRVAARLEKVLGFFKPGVFDEEKESLYPAQWENAGTAQGEGKFFHTTHLLLWIGAAFLILAILLTNTPVHREFYGSRLMNVNQKMLHTKSPKICHICNILENHP